MLDCSTMFLSRYMGDLHLVLPALNVSTLGAGILIMVQQVRLMMFSLNMVDYSMSFLLLSTCHFFHRQVVADRILLSAPVPLGLIGTLNWVGVRA